MQAVAAEFTIAVSRHSSEDPERHRVSLSIASRCIALVIVRTAPINALNGSQQLLSLLFEQHDLVTISPSPGWRPKMKAICAVGFALVVSTHLIAQENQLQANRLQVATAWLSNLCVLPQGDFLLPTQADLTSAFAKWINSAATPSCEGNVPADSSGKKPQPKIKADIDSLRLRPIERIARIGQFQLNIQQTPDYVYGIPEGAPPTTPSTFLPNNQHSLLSLGGPLFLNELYVPADTRVGICSALFPKDLDPLSKDDPNTRTQPGDTASLKRKAKIRNTCGDSKYIEALRKKDYLFRLAAAMTLNINASQVPNYEPPILLKSLSSVGYPFWSKNITGSFTPSMLFRTAAEKKALAGYAGSLKIFYFDRKEGMMIKVMNKPQVLNDLCNRGKGAPPDATESPDYTDKCISTITIGGLTQRLTISMLPVINVKVTTPFDLVKYGTSFIPPPDQAARSLYNVTFVWDLRSLLASTTQRLDAFNALVTLATPDTPDKTTPAQSKSPLSEEQLKEAQWRRAVAGLYIELQSIPSQCLNEQWWAKFETTVLREK